MLNWSLPTRECGLKFLKRQARLEKRRVTPYAGVWIEICSELHACNASVVTPYAGVWIEIVVILQAGSS